MYKNLLSAIVIMLMPFAGTAYAQNINTPDYFPDENFRIAAEEFMGAAPDGSFTADQAAAMDAEFICNDRGITDMSGLEFFTNISKLDCSNNQLTTLDLSGFLRLSSLDCYNNKLESLTISDCPQLSYLDATNNSLTDFDASTCESLSILISDFNQLQNINLSNCSALTELYCWHNRLTTLDASDCVNLTFIDCSENQLASMNIGNCASLLELDCWNNQLTDIDISRCAHLTQLYCSNNQLTSLNISNNAFLQELDCRANQLTEFNVDQGSNLIFVDCSANNITVMTINNLSSLETIRCEQNQLTLLDCANNTALKELYGSNNQLEDIILENCLSLHTIDLSFNQLTGLSPLTEGIMQGIPLNVVYVGHNQLDCDDWDDVVFLRDLLSEFEYSPQWSIDPFNCAEDGNINTPNHFPDPHFRTEVENFMGVSPGKGFSAVEAAERSGTLDCSNCEISNADGLRHLTGITALICSQNHLTSLDVSQNDQLAYLDCSGNEMTELNLGAAPLIDLLCYNNQLKTLNLSGCDKLKNVNCHSNQLAVLDLSNNAQIKDVYCRFNEIVDLQNFVDNKSLFSLDVSNNKLTCDDWSFVQILEDRMGSYFTFSPQYGIDPFVCPPPSSVADPNESRTSYLAFDGKDDYASVNKSFTWDVLQSESEGLTFECWVKLNSADSLILSDSIFNLKNAPSKEYPEYIFHYSFNYRYRQQTGPLIEELENTIQEDIILGGGWNLNEWNHAAFIFDRTNRQIGYAINGNISYQLIPHANIFLNIEDLKNFQLSAIDHSFEGKIDELRISDIVRYRSRFQPEAVFTPDSHTIALYHFDDPVEAKTFEDGTGNGNTMSGFYDAHIEKNNTRIDHWSLY